MELQLNPETNFYSDYGIYHVPFFKTPWFWWTCFFVGVIIFAVLFYFIGKKIYTWYKKKNLTPWAKELQELDALEQQRNWGLKSEQIY